MYNKGLSLIYESPLGTGRFCNILPSKGSQLPLEGKYVNVNIHFSLLLYGVYSLQCTVQYSKGVWGIHKLIEQELAITMQVKIQCLHKFHFLSVAVLRLQRVRQEKSSIDLLEIDPCIFGKFRPHFRQIISTRATESKLQVNLKFHITTPP